MKINMLCYQQKRCSFSLFQDFIGLLNFTVELEPHEIDAFREGYKYFKVKSEIQARQHYQHNPIISVSAYARIQRFL